MTAPVRLPTDNRNRGAGEQDKDRDSQRRGDNETTAHAYPLFADGSDVD
jgi:hypothetical protein